MGYLHIPNLYKDQRILMFRECYALEKIHGTSAHIAWKDGGVRFFSGGERHDRFFELFDTAALAAAFLEHRVADAVVYGEAYGGKQQAQSWRYGPELKFIAFDVLMAPYWLAVPNAHDFVTKSLGLEFVHYRKVVTDLAALDAERDAPSEQAKRNGVEGDQPREGVVLRPLVEFLTNNGDRIIAKHKRDDERETRMPRKVEPGELEALTKAAEIADEWVTPMRLEHVLDKLGPDVGIERTRDVISAMVEDVVREGAGEIVDSKAARAAIARKAAVLFKDRLKAALANMEGVR